MDAWRKDKDLVPGLVQMQTSKAGCGGMVPGASPCQASGKVACLMDEQEEEEEVGSAGQTEYPPFPEIIIEML